MKKILVLELDNVYGMLRSTNECDYYNYFKYSNNNKLQKVLKKTNLIIAQFFFGKWKEKIQEYDMCILFDRGFNKLVTKYIKKKNPKCKIILWLWNPVSKRHLKFIKDKNLDEIWTYDLNDSKKYNLKFNTQFYNKNFANNTDVKTDFDIMFIGNNKGREQIINNYLKDFNSIDLNSYIRIINDYKDNIPYKEYINYLEKTKCLLEIVKDDVSGLTLRALESIFFKKKLITNNKFIKDYEFYNSENIFILGEDNICNLKLFVNSNYTDLDEDLIDYYDFDKWIKRFY